MEDLKKNVKMLEKKLDTNVELILNNMNKLHNHEEMINKNALKIKENSYVLSILKDYKADSKRLFYIVLILLALLICTWGFLLFSR